MLVVIAVVLAGIIGYLAFVNQDQNLETSRSPAGQENTASSMSEVVSGGEGRNEIVKPPAPGPFVADAVRNLAPNILRVGSNQLSAEVRGYMFFEGETHLALYDGTKEINIGTRADGLPNTVVSAQGEWMTEGYVQVQQTITIPAELRGKTLVLRFIANDQRDDARPRYWGTVIAVE